MVPGSTISQNDRTPPFFLVDIERETACVYWIMARDAGVDAASTVPTYPAIVLCPSAVPERTSSSEARGHDLARGLRDLLLQRLAWSLRPDALDGVPTPRPPYALYWSQVSPTTEILAALHAQSRLNGPDGLDGDGWEARR